MFVLLTKSKLFTQKERSAHSLLPKLVKMVWIRKEQM